MTSNIIVLGRIATALGDPTQLVWSNTTLLTWLNEAVAEFPILRPLEKAQAIATATYTFALPADFREVIWVEYPISQTPPALLKYKSHLDPNFYTSEEHYDVDRNYNASAGYMLWTSAELPAGSTVKVSYLGLHNYSMIYGDQVSVPDQYHNILILYVVWKAYIERLSLQLQLPTAHTSLIQQYTIAVQTAQQAYQDAVKVAVDEVTDSRQTPPMAIDGYDRIY